jgi:arylsulfate sulfotransferase
MTGDLREVDLAGNTIRDVSVAQVNQSLQANAYSFSITAFSHDILTLPNGHWITIGLISKDFTDLPGYPGTTNVTGDSVLDIDPNGNVVWGWSAFDYLDVNRHLQGLPDWTHGNALFYTADGNLLMSMRHQSWILKLDYGNGTGTGKILWKLGENGDFTLEGGDPAQWFYGQHDPNILSTSGSQTTMAVYDDGNLRIDVDGVACGSTASAPACYSRATIFQIDESTKIASLVWQDLPGYFSPWGGSIGALSNGDMEFDSSQPFNAISSQITEVTPTDTPQTVWQMNITGEWAYRGRRIPSLYPGVTWQK